MLLVPTKTRTHVGMYCFYRLYTVTILHVCETLSESHYDTVYVFFGVAGRIHLVHDLLVLWYTRPSACSETSPLSQRLRARLRTLQWQLAQRCWPPCQWEQMPSSSRATCFTGRARVDDELNCKTATEETSISFESR